MKRKPDKFDKMAERTRQIRMAYACEVDQELIERIARVLRRVDKQAYRREATEAIREKLERRK